MRYAKSRFRWNIDVAIASQLTPRLEMVEKMFR